MEDQHAQPANDEERVQLISDNHLHKSHSLCGERGHDYQIVDNLSQASLCDHSDHPNKQLPPKIENPTKISKIVALFKSFLTKCKEFKEKNCKNKKCKTIAELTKYNNKTLLIRLALQCSTVAFMAKQSKKFSLRRKEAQKNLATSLSFEKTLNQNGLAYYKNSIDNQTTIIKGTMKKIQNLEVVVETLENNDKQTNILSFREKKSEVKVNLKNLDISKKESLFPIQSDKGKVTSIVASLGCFLSSSLLKFQIKSEGLKIDNSFYFLGRKAGNILKADKVFMKIDTLKHKIDKRVMGAFMIASSIVAAVFVFKAAKTAAALVKKNKDKIKEVAEEVEHIL